MALTAKQRDDIIEYFIKYNTFVDIEKTNEDAVLSNFSNEVRPDILTFLNTNTTFFTRQTREGKMYYGITQAARIHIHEDGGYVKKEFYKDEPLRLTRLSNKTSFNSLLISILSVFLVPILSLWMPLLPICLRIVVSGVLLLVAIFVIKGQIDKQKQS